MRPYRTIIRNINKNYRSRVWRLLGVKAMLCMASIVEAWKRISISAVKKIPDGHLFPFEYPARTEIAIKEAIAEMLS